MIEINLLPDEIKKKRKKIELPDISFLSVIAVFLGVIVIVHLLVGLITTVKSKTLKRLERTWQSILPDKERADNLKAELAASKAKISAINSLVEGRRSWARRLNDISDAMIAGVWLNKLWLEKRVVIEDTAEGKVNPREKSAKAGEPKEIILKTLHLKGSVITVGGDETATIGKFIRSLKDNVNFMSDFSDIESVSIQRVKLKDEEVMDFELICYFK